jgi:hypothetical protein
LPRVVRLSRKDKRETTDAVLRIRDSLPPDDALSASSPVLPSTPVNAK